MRDNTAPWWPPSGAVALPRHLQSARGSRATTNQVAATPRGRALRGRGCRAVAPVTVWVQVEGWPSATQGGRRPTATGMFFPARFSYATRYKHVVRQITLMSSRWHGVMMTWQVVSLGPETQQMGGVHRSDAASWMSFQHSINRLECITACETEFLLMITSDLIGWL